MKYLSIILIFSLVVFGCSNADNSISQSAESVGKGGSMARFTILNNYLYTVDDASLNVFSIATNNNPVFLNKVYIGFQIETLFSYDNNLFIGSQSGMFIYSLENPEVPTRESAIEHFTACDPVVTDGEFAYVTLHSDSNCGNELNVLEIYDVTDIEAPVLLQTRNMISPKGLSLYHNYLLVCDDELKIFDVTEPNAMAFVKSIDINGFDVIIQNDHLIVVGEEGLYQYILNNNNIGNITYLSTINY